MRRRNVIIAVVLVLAGMLWFKVAVIPHVSFTEIYHNIRVDLGLETGAERR